MVWSDVGFLTSILPHVLWAFWSVSLILENLSRIISTYFFHPFPFFFFCYSLLCVSSFVILPQFLDILFPPPFFSFHSFFLFDFQFKKYLLTSWSSLILSSALPSLLMSPWETVLLSVTVFLISSISFWSFLRVAISLLTSVLILFPTRNFSLLVIIIFNSWSDNSEIFAILEFLLLALSSQAVFLLAF